MRKVLTFLAASVVLTWVAPVMAQSAPDQFKDVEPNHWAYPAMEALRAKGIVIGYPDGYFRGRRTLSRYEFAVALDRALKSIPAGKDGKDGTNGVDGQPGKDGKDGVDGKDVDPAELDALKKLTKEFKDELGSMGNTVNAINAKLDGLAKDVAALKEAFDKAPKISGTAFFGVRADRAAGQYVDRNSSYFGYYGEGGSVGTPLFRDPTVVHELQIGVDAKLAGGATLATKLNIGNYAATLDERLATVDGDSYGGYGTDWAKNAAELVWLDQMEIKAPFSGIGREGSLSIGRFNIQGAKYMLQKPDVDVYMDNPILDDGAYRADGLKLTTKLGSLGVEAFGVQTKSVQTTDWDGGINSPQAGMNWMTVDQMVGLSGKLPVRMLDGGYLRLAALGVSNNTNIGYNGESTVLILGADSKVKVSERMGVDVDWAKSITGFGSFKTAPGGASQNNAAEGKITYDAGKVKVAAGYKYIDPLFYTPGSWGRIGPWLNPTGVKGPTVWAKYAVSDALCLHAGAEFLTGVSQTGDYLWPSEDLNKVTACLCYKLSKVANVSLSWEGDYAKTYAYYYPATKDSYTRTVHPTMQYVNIGTSYALTSGTVLKVGYEIGDYNGKNTNFLTDGPAHFNYNVFTTQVAVKF